MGDFANSKGKGEITLVQEEVRAMLAKSITAGGGKSPEELDLAVRRIVSRAISSDKVIDIFDAAGLKKPDISILSDEFLAEVQHLPQRNLAVELLQKLLNNELKLRSKKYFVQSRSFAEMLEATIRKYQNRRILRKHGYPPDKQEKTTQTVLEQAKLLCAEWAH
jgi:type I restriction enzyme R subunit